MVVHSFSASHSEENSDSRFAQRLWECLPPEEKSVTWARAEGDLKKLHATPLGSHVKQILSWITAGMQRKMMTIPGWNPALGRATDGILPPLGSFSGALQETIGGPGRSRAHHLENRSQSRSERTSSIR